MREVDLKNYFKKRKKNRIIMINLRENIEKNKCEQLRNRDIDKALLLYNAASKKRERLFERIGEREYRLR
jgi:hypothetical protein